MAEAATVVPTKFQGYVVFLHGSQIFNTVHETKARNLAADINTAIARHEQEEKKCQTQPQT